LDNTIEISAALNTLASEGYLLSIDEVAALSPYQTRHVKRFGNYEIDFEAVPTLIADDLTFKLELPAPSEVIEAVQETEYQTSKYCPKGELLSSALVGVLSLSEMRTKVRCDRFLQ